ncbi:hypothetical protein pb186bvf_012530 [Paramecium bursaria]
MNESRRPKQLDLNYKIDILEIEKIKLHEEIEYLNQHIQQITETYTEKIMSRDQEIVNTQIQSQQLEKFNQELLQKLQNTRKNEEQLNHANYNFVQMQKKTSSLASENQELQNKVIALQNQVQQAQQNWQRCSQQLKQVTSGKQKYKDIEQMYEKKADEYNLLKEKYVQTQLELTVIKQSEQEYKLSVQNKIQQLLEQLKQAQYQSQMMQNVIQQDRCQKCLEKDDELENYRNIIQNESLSQEQARVHKQINQQLQQQIKEQYDKLLEYELENNNLIKQIEFLQDTQNDESNLINSMKKFEIKSKSLREQPEYIKLAKLVEQIVKDNQSQELFKRALNDLVREVDSRESVLQQLQECRSMYDRLVVKYYALQKRLKENEQDTSFVEESIPPPVQNQQKSQFTSQKRPIADSFLSQQDTTKQVKKTHEFSNTPKPVRKQELQYSGQKNRQLNMSLDTSGYQYLKK